MFDRRNIRRIYLNITEKTKDFLLSDKSREFFVFLFFFFVAGGFWLLQTLNNDYEAEFSIPVRLRGVPNNTMITSEPASELRIKVKDKGTVLLNYMLGKSFYPISLDFSDYNEAGYAGVHLCNRSVQAGPRKIGGNGQCRSPVLFVGYGFQSGFGSGICAGGRIRYDNCCLYTAC